MNLNFFEPIFVQFYLSESIKYHVLISLLFVFTNLILIRYHFFENSFSSNSQSKKMMDFI